MIGALLGTGQDVRGFALAGLEGQVCESSGELARAAAALRARPEVALILVSRTLARLAPAEIARFQAPEGPPALVVLPGGGG